MPWYFNAIKFAHILSAIIAFGFNATYAVWIVRGQRDTAHLDFALRGVKFLDDYFANPAYLLLLITGLGMVFIARFQLTTFWLLGGLILWGVAMLLGFFFYTPTLRQQIQTLAANGPASVEYQRVANRGTALGVSLAIIVGAIVFLMVFKPTF